MICSLSFDVFLYQRILLPFKTSPQKPYRHWTKKIWESKKTKFEGKCGPVRHVAEFLKFCSERKVYCDKKIIDMRQFDNDNKDIDDSTMATRTWEQQESCYGNRTVQQRLPLALMWNVLQICCFVSS